MLPLFEGGDVFDHTLNSYDLRAIKAENPEAMFGDYLRSIGKTFADSILIDDRPVNIEPFVAMGGTGTAVQIQNRLYRQDARHIV